MQHVIRDCGAADARSPHYKLGPHDAESILVSFSSSVDLALTPSSRVISAAQYSAVREGKPTWKPLPGRGSSRRLAQGAQGPSLEIR